MVLDSLWRAVSSHGLTFGPDPSSHSRCTLGGMIGNNACGSHSVAWGATVDNVERLHLLLADGTRLTADRTGLSGPAAAKSIEASLHALADRNLAVIRNKFGRFPRQHSGYALHQLLPERGRNIAGSLVGTEGTCATVLGATLRLVSAPPARVLLVLGYPDVIAAAEAVPAILPHRPLTVEGMDAGLLDGLRRTGRQAAALAALPSGSSWLFVEVDGPTVAAAEHRAIKLGRQLPGSAANVVTDPAEQAALWRIREDGAGIATRLPDGGEAWPGWEDAAVPPQRLADYLREFADLRAQYRLRGVAYGHFGEGCIHVRLDFDLISRLGRDRYAAFLADAADLVVALGGSLTGEHGDGLARSALLPRLYGTDGVALLGEFKRIWDPDALMNPGVVVDPPPVTADIRIAFAPRPRPAGGLGYPEDGGDFTRAVRRCVGVGRCRNTEGGVMCPSWQVTRDEKHSTRGRARLLLEMQRGEVVTGGWRSPEVAEALDLCLACKGCLSDCPVNVDMASYKSEFLHHHFRRRFRPVSHYTMGWLPLLARPASAAPSLANALTGGAVSAPVVKRLGGVAPERELPRLADPTFRRWFNRRRAVPDSAGRPEVVLWPDTFMSYFTPWIGRAAVEVLEAAGFSVRVPSGQLCCGLTWISTGQLDVARLVARRTLAALTPYAEAGIPILGLEPSCLAVFRHDLAELLTGDDRVGAVADAAMTLSELLTRRAPAWTPTPVNRKALVQTHCHQHAILGFDVDQQLFARAGIGATVLDSGCCGMAGNFGFERSHYGVSRAAAERVLFPAVRAADATTLLLADGFSCRTQVAHGTGRRAYHLAEVLAASLTVPR